MHQLYETALPRDGLPSDLTALLTANKDSRETANPALLCGWWGGKAGNKTEGRKQSSGPGRGGEPAQMLHSPIPAGCQASQELQRPAKGLCPASHRHAGAATCRPCPGEPPAGPEPDPGPALTRSARADSARSAAPAAAPARLFPPRHRGRDRPLRPPPAAARPGPAPSGIARGQRSGSSPVPPSRPQPRGVYGFRQKAGSCIS